MNVSEYIVKFLEENGINKVFGVVGGAALWICKALNENKNVGVIFTNHEQAAAMAADGWARAMKKPGVVFTINGPGMTNAVTGIAQAWVDSSPVMLITGNSNLGSIKYERENNVRQYGTQDVRTDLIMQPITKKTFLVERAEDIKSIMQEAYFISMEGRPGPVCIEVPINIQSAQVPEIMRNWEGEKNFAVPDRKQIQNVLDKLCKAKRPLILAGQGVRLSDSVDLFRAFFEKLDTPVVTSRMGIDIISTDSRYFVGRLGNHGDRASHFAIQQCDVMLILGSRLAPNTTGYDVKKFSDQSYKILVDIEKNELKKFGLDIHQSIQCDIKSFLKNAIQLTEGKLNIQHKDWVECCAHWKKSYPIMQKEYYKKGPLSTYRVIDKISKISGENDYIISDTGSACCIAAQVWNIKGTQRMFISGGLSAMGYWATSIGLAAAENNEGQVICLVGDGSLQMNIHELATIKHHKLPIKMFIINNNGYQFVKMSQMSYGINPTFGTDLSTGVPIPNIKKVVEAYELKYVHCSCNETWENIIEEVLNEPECVICEVFVDENQEVRPRLKSVALQDGSFKSPEYGNLFPFLDNGILEEEMNRAGK